MVVYNPESMTISTRGHKVRYSFSDAIIEGLAPDGGLLVPEQYPKFSMDDLKEMRELEYKDLAFRVLKRFSSGIPDDKLLDIINKTYNEKNFGSDSIVRLYKIERNFYTEDLSNGPAQAFKDIALQFLGNTWEYELARRNSFLNFFGASSGDTVSSAEEAIRSRSRMTIAMLTPFEMMSLFQTAQAYSIVDPNVLNIALNGPFDTCQDIVKVINEDLEFKQRYRLGAVNSINWGRVAAQIIYYFKGYFDATTSLDQQVDFAVPTGNFGDIFAGYVAKKMGLPIRRLILATNENNVLDVFFKNGIYRPVKREDVIATSSPSMDISKASNLERYLFDITGRNTSLLADWMNQLRTQGFLDLSDTFYFKAMKNSGIVSGTSTHKDRIGIIREIEADRGLIVDPHTADGIKVGIDYRDLDTPLICLSTAKPLKFEATIEEALGYVPERPMRFRGLEQKEQKYVRMDPDVEKIKELIAKHAITD